MAAGRRPIYTFKTSPADLERVGADPWMQAVGAEKDETVTYVSVPWYRETLTVYWWTIPAIAWGVGIVLTVMYLRCTHKLQKYWQAREEKYIRKIKKLNKKLGGKKDGKRVQTVGKRH